MRAVVVHDLVQAVAALRAAAALGVPVVLRSAPEGAARIGALVFRETITLAALAVPGARFRAVLDCGAAPGHALNALRLGLKGVRLDAPPEVLARVADIAGQLGAIVETALDPALDLVDLADPEGACRAWLSEDR